MDISKLKTSDWVIAASGLVLLIASFLDWFTVEIDGGELFGTASAGGNGWDVGFFWAGIPVIIGLAMIAVVAIRAFSPETKLPDLPIGWGQTLFIAGVVAAVIVVLKLLIGEDVDGAEAFGIEVKRAFGLFLASLAAIGLAVGGFLEWQEEKSGAGDVAAPGTGAPPPPGGSSF
ncbi:MAG TPA: hypothetical protein VFZ77_05615 [Acidimicrobiales bacterium]